jgi:hypothetical protein
VNRAIADLGVDMNMHSDPVLLNDILRNDMFLADVPGVVKRLGSKLQTSELITPMLEHIRKTIVEKHPAIVEFLCRAHDEKFLEKGDFTRFIHHMFIFEDIVSGMADDPDLMREVYEAFLKKRAEHAVRSGFIGSLIDIYKAGGGVFGAIKAKTMDGVLEMYQEIRDRGEILDEEVDSRTKGLKLNIREAYMTDLLHGNRDNSYAGYALATISPEAIRLVGPERRIQYIYDQEWASLYETWNFAFIIPELTKRLPIIAQKLLIPSVIDADPKDYLFNRVLALWASINFFLFADLEKRPEFILPNAEAIGDLWGKINYIYARRYIEHKAKTNWHAYLLLKKFEFHEFHLTHLFEDDSDLE